MAERGGFEPPVPGRVHTLSRRAPSASSVISPQPRRCIVPQKINVNQFIFGNGLIPVKIILETQKNKKIFFKIKSVYKIK